MEMEKASNKLKFIKDHLGVVTGVEPKVVDYGGSDASKPKSEYFKWNGWGYKDTKLFYDRQKGYGQISGSRYSFSGSELKELQKFAEKDASMDVTGEPVAMQEKMKVDAPYVNEAFLEAVEGQYSRLSFDEGERMTHSHGHTLHVYRAPDYGWDRRCSRSSTESSRDSPTASYTLAPTSTWRPWSARPRSKMWC